MLKEIEEYEEEMMECEEWQEEYEKKKVSEEKSL
jgi:hypothetical protein